MVIYTTKHHGKLQCKYEQNPLFLAMFHILLTLPDCIYIYIELVCFPVYMFFFGDHSCFFVGNGWVVIAIVGDKYKPSYSTSFTYYGFPAALSLPLL